MSIEVDWQIIEGEQDEPEVIAAPPPPRQKRKLPLWLMAVALVLVVAVAIFSVYVITAYRTQLAHATQEVKVVAKLEAKAVATNDQPSFMALQDPNDAAFRAMQERRFGRLDRMGLPEFGLSATSAAPQFGSVSLEPDWQAYLRAQAGLAPYVTTALPKGELALECMTGPSAISFSILRVRADGTDLAPMTDRGQSAFYPAWSPDGKRLAFAQDGQVVVMDANDRRALKTIPGGSSSMFRFGWLPDGQLWIDRSPDGGLYRVNVDTGQDVAIKGTHPILSPDGTRMAYLEYVPDPVIWMADTNGHHAHPVALGNGLPGSPDGVRPAQEINWVSGPTWSPDGTMIAMTVWRSDGPALLVLDSRTGVILAQKRGITFSSRTWSADGRYVAFQPEPDSSFRAAVGILDVWTIARCRCWAMVGIGHRTAGGWP